jgi:hypothetical protein
MSALTLEQVVARLRRWTPCNEEEVLRTCGIPLQYIGEGGFRAVYNIPGLSSVVLKIPLTDANDWYKHPECIEHSQVEIRHLKNILSSRRKYKAIQPYMPLVHYASPSTGLILVKKYARPTSHYRPQMEALERTIAEVTRVRDPDVNNFENVGVDTDGSLKVIDLGCLDRTESWLL